MGTYGGQPEPVGTFDLEWVEYMHYLYLPIVMPDDAAVCLPKRLSFLEDLIYEVLGREAHYGGRGENRYVYVTARRGYASPGNPLNRPGWHCDGFGTEDVNYIWTDRYPTRFATGDFDDVSTDHVVSAKQFEDRIDGRADLCDRCGGYGQLDPLHGGPGHEAFASDQCVPCPGCPIQVSSGEPNTLYRLDPFVVHSTPIIPAPGGERSFLKISLSRSRYNLRGNSHNHLFDYDWRMWSRAEIRNDPAYAGGDAGPQAFPSSTS